jgi:succinyl-CoA synthetase beta subunit
MKLHEYQAKELLKKYGVPVPDGRVAFEVEEAVGVAKEISFPVVVKAQIHAGGRGKGGGIKVAKDADEVRGHAQSILGMTLVTVQTGPAGKKVNRLLIERTADISRELYLAVTADRSRSRPVMIASAAGGMEIEQVAASSPEKILKESIDPAVGFQSYQGRKLAFALGLDPRLVNPFSFLASAIYKTYAENDASLVEINPLVVTKDGKLVALDAKIDLDDNALYRHKSLEEWRDVSEEDPAELEAKKFDLNYVSLSGTIGCMVNGAGLAMATMDLIKLHGGEPANFLDVGGGATKENVAEAFKIILRDPKVKSILINIFGGIMRCDVIAEGVVAAAKELSVTVPLVVRLQGTNVEKGREILKDAKLNIVAIDDLAAAAKKAVELSK